MPKIDILSKPIMILEKASQWLVYALVFLLPLYFLPTTSSYFEMNKQLLLWVLVSLASILQLSAVLVKREFAFRTNILYVPILIYAVLNGLSVIFSLDWYSSLFGAQAVFSGAFTGTAAMAVFFCLFTNLFGAKEAKLALRIFSYSIFVLMFLSLLSFLGIFGQYFGSIFVNLAGAKLTDLGVLAIVLSLFGMIRLVYLGRDDAGYGYIGFQLSSILFAWLVLMFLDFSILWIVDLLVVILFALLYFLKIGKRRPDSSHFGLGTAIMLMAFVIPLIFLFNPGFTPADNQLYKSEINLGLNKSYRISSLALRQTPYFGSGQGTYGIDYSAFRDKGDNYTEYWQLRFNQAGSRFLEDLATLGVFGTFVGLLLNILFVYLGFVLWQNSHKAGKPNEMESLTVFLILFLLLIAQFFVIFNTVLLFCGWLFMALAFGVVHDDGEGSRVLAVKRKIDLAANPGMLVFFLLVYVAVIAAGVSLSVLALKFTAADTAYARGVDKQSEADLEKAVRLNPSRSQYMTALSRVYLNKSITAAENSDLDELKRLAQLSLANAKAAVKQSPHSPISWETLGMVYRDISNISSGGALMAINAFAQALELEPTNPILATEIGKLYMELGDHDSAIAMFEQALDLKGDYTEARFSQAKALAGKNKYREALDILYAIADVSENPQVYYEIGRLHFNLGELDLAKNNFLRVLEYVPEHSNSLYSLGLTYELLGEMDAALDYYNQVLKLNPDSQEVKDKIELITQIIGAETGTDQ